VADEVRAGDGIGGEEELMSDLFISILDGAVTAHHDSLCDCCCYHHHYVCGTMISSSIFVSFFSSV
jgi:hypothetical protein